MKASELIKRLQDAKKRYGDIPVVINQCCWGEGEVDDVKAWTERGDTPDLRKKTTDPATRIQLY